MRPKPIAMPMRGSSRPANIARKKPIVAPMPRMPRICADDIVRIAGMLLQQRWQQHHGREVQHAVDRHQDEADRIVAIQQQPQIQEGPLCREAMGEEQIERRAAPIVSKMISPDSNQSSRWPRDSTSCAQDIAAASVRKPIQSSRTRASGLSRGSVSHTADHRRKADRHQHVECPAPAVCLGQDSRRGSGRSPVR